MEKRLIVAIALTFLVLLSWSAIATKLQPVGNKEVTAIKTESVPALQIMSKQAAPDLLEPIPSATPTFSYTQDSREIIFVESLAVIKEIIFKAYQNHKLPLEYGFWVAEKDLAFRKESSNADSVTFTHSDSSKKITKRFSFPKRSNDIWLEIIIQNVSNAPLALDLPLVLGRLNFAGNNIQTRYQDVFIATKEKSQHFNGRKNLEFQNIKFLGLRDKYFCAIIEPETAGCSGLIKKITPQVSELSLLCREIAIAPGQQIGQKFHIYVGPQDAGMINKINPSWSMIVNYGTFDFISQILLQALGFLYNMLHNWGWAIVALSILVYICLFPLTLKQMRSMKEMQILQPKIEELRRTLKDNPQKLNKEIMELYREHKVNPLGGCLPLVLQMPIFFALYQALMRSVVLKGSNFLWIKDLSEPDRLFILPTSLPVLGNEINILPIIMTIGALLQQKFTMAAATSGSAEQQKLMMMLFPVMIGFIFYHMPAGLVLYWLINSFLMLAHQIYITRKQ